MFIAFRRDGMMGLFLVFFWCLSLVRDILRYNSRFGVFNSRLGLRNFPFSLLRELTDKGLICLVVFSTKMTTVTESPENSRYHAKNRKFDSRPQPPPFAPPDDQRRR
jgi:hypothetical protein